MHIKDPVIGRTHWSYLKKKKKKKLRAKTTEKDQTTKKSIVSVDRQHWYNFITMSTIQYRIYCSSPVLYIY